MVWSHWLKRLVQNSQHCFSQYPIFTGKSKSAREFDWTQMAGNSSEMTVAKLNHRTWVSPYSRRIEAHHKDSLSSSCPVSPPFIDCSLTGMEIYMTSVKQVINLQQLLYILMDLREQWGRNKWVVRKTTGGKFPWWSVVQLRSWI